MVLRHHDMPFGAQVLDDGRVRFQLWAPDVNHVELCLEGGEEDTCLPMAQQDEGFFAITTDSMPGTLYKYRIDDLLVVDPASRFQPEDVQGPSQVVDPRSWQWFDQDWRGRPWNEMIVYELHVGSFTAQGTFQSAVKKLDYLADLGITAVQLMPIADFPGRWNWGYDGVLLFAPDSRYGLPEHIKEFVQTAHSKGLMVYLDVVYNHFGPQGNYLYRYASNFFSQRHHTPWGDGINFDGTDCNWVRRFFIHNALYWLEEYHFDGLRFDSVHLIKDDSPQHFLVDLAHAIKRRPEINRHVHLLLENDNNQAIYLQPDNDGQPLYNAQWNDDFHHALHVMLTNERDGYYQDYLPEPGRYFQRCLKEGFAYQGEISAYRGKTKRGEDSRSLPPTAFISFLQNHDQIGNRALGERIHQLAQHQAIGAMLAILLLAPSIPLLFMGQEWGSEQPFPFFSDLEQQLAEQVRRGRLKEFARFKRFQQPAMQARIPDPFSETTFQSAVLNWDHLLQPQHCRWYELHRELINIRRRYIVPLLNGISVEQTESFTANAFTISWVSPELDRLILTANLDPEPAGTSWRPSGRVLYQTQSFNITEKTLPPWTTVWLLDENKTCLPTS